MEDHMAKPDIYTRITEKSIADLEAGTRPWHKPWSADHLACESACKIDPLWWVMID